MFRTDNELEIYMMSCSPVLTKALRVNKSEMTLATKTSMGTPVFLSHLFVMFFISLPNHLHVKALYVCKELSRT